MKDKENTQQTFDLPEFVNNQNYSVKSDALAMAALGSNVKASYKRVFEGWLSQVKWVDIEDFIEKDKPLIVILTVPDYNRMFPRDPKILDVFDGAIKYYTKNTSVEVWPDNNFKGSPKYINVIDTAEMLDDGSIKVMFTRGILPHLKSVRDRILVLDLRYYSKLSSKYSQKLYEIFCDVKNKKVITYRLELEGLRKILSISETYSNSRLRLYILEPALNEINEKTDIHSEFELIKAEKGKAFKYVDFIVYTKEEYTKLELEDKRKSESLEDAVNQYKKLGVSDDQFLAILQLRKDKGKPVYQESMNAYFGIMVSIANDESTKSMSEILSIVLMHGYVSRLEKDWFINPKYTAKPKPKNNGNTAKRNTKEEKPKGIPSPKEMLKNALEKKGND